MIAEPKHKMSGTNNILLVTRDADTVRQLTDALASEERFRLVGVSADIAEAGERLSKESIAVALVDIDPEPLSAFRNMEPVIARFPTVRFAVLSDAMRNDLVFEAMQIGVRHYLTKKSIGLDLPNVLQRLLPAVVANPGLRGAIVTVLSGSGGCGATTVACNLANELASVNSRTALLMDLDCCYGAASSYLGLKPRYGVADVLRRGQDADAELIRSTAVQHSDALHVLASPASTNFAAPGALDYTRISGALELCRMRYGHTVLDAPRAPMNVAAALAHDSDVTLVVFQLTVKDIHMTRAIRTALLDNGVAPDQIILVANRYRRWSPVTLDEARTALGDARVELIRNDFRNAVRSINYGKLLSDVAPVSGLRRDINRVAVTVNRMGSKVLAGMR